MQFKACCIFHHLKKRALCPARKKLHVCRLGWLTCRVHAMVLEGGKCKGAGSRRRVFHRILHKMHMQNFTAPLRVVTAATAANKKIFI